MVDGLRMKGAANLDLLLPDGACCLRGVRRRRSGSGARSGDAADRRAQAITEHAGYAACIRRLNRGRYGSSANRVPAPPPRYPASRRAGKDGTTPRSRRNSLARTCAIFGKLLNEYRYRADLLRPLRPRLHPHAGQFRSAERSRHPPIRRSSWIGPPISSWATADRFRASTATASLAAPCCRRCSGPS